MYEAELPRKLQVPGTRGYTPVGSLKSMLSRGWIFAVDPVDLGFA